MPSMHAPRTMKIKDPSARGNVVYDVPLEYIERTVGFEEHYKGYFVPVHQGHRPCLCKLFQEGRCGQHEKCKSFHVSRDFVRKCREEFKVQIDDRFVSEVVVTMRNGIVFAVRFPAVERTKGLDSYLKKLKKSPNRIEAAPLCEAYNPDLGMAGTCPLEKKCPKIHVQHSELRDLVHSRLRTPCCKDHGAAMTPCAPVQVVVGGRSWSVPPNKLALTNGLHPEKRFYEPQDVCVLHIRSRCKYGRACGKLHICRTFAEQVKLYSALEQVATPPSTPRGRGTPKRSSRSNSVISDISNGLTEDDGTPRSNAIMPAAAAPATWATTRCAAQPVPLLPSDDADDFSDMPPLEADLLTLETPTSDSLGLASWFPDCPPDLSDYDETA